MVPTVHHIAVLDNSVDSYVDNSPRQAILTVTTMAQKNMIPRTTESGSVTFIADVIASVVVTVVIVVAIVVVVVVVVVFVAVAVVVGSVAISAIAGLQTERNARHAMVAADLALSPPLCISTA